MILEAPTWTSEDAAILRQFLTTSTGQKFLQMVEYRRPEFFPANSHPHRSFAQSRDIAGYERALREIQDLTGSQEEQKEPTPAYPDLEDERFWPNPD